MRTSIIVSCALMLMVGRSWAVSDNEKLRELFEADQSDRKAWGTSLNGSQIVEHDMARQRAVLEIMQQGRLATGNDYFHAAMVFQHSNSADDNALAYGLAVIAARIDPSIKLAKWLSAAAWDRTLMRRNKPQWYGTQFVKNFETGKWELYKIDETAVSDQDRERTGVPPLSKQREKEKEMNQVQ